MRGTLLWLAFSMGGVAHAQEPEPESEGDLEPYMSEPSAPEAGVDSVVEPPAPAPAPAPPTDAEPSPSERLALEPYDIKLFSLPPATTEAERLSYADLARALQESVAKATVQGQHAKTAASTATQRLRVASASVKAARADLAARKKELKVAKIGGSNADQRQAQASIDRSAEAVTAGLLAKDVAEAELGVARADLSVARAIIDLEKAKLACVKGKMAMPVLGEADLLKLERARLKASTATSRALARVAAARASLERARQARDA